MRSWLVPSCFFLLTACGSNNRGDDTARAADSSNESAQAAADAADSSASGDSAVSEPLGFRPRLSVALNANFSFNGCMATLDANLVLGAFSGTVDLTGATCSLGRTVSGTETFAGNVGNGNRTLNIAADVNITLSSGDIVSITSDDPNNATYSLSASGYAAANANVAIDANVNEHRARNTAAGHAVYDMDITTTTPLSIQDQYDANSVLQARVIVSGTNTVHHLLDKYTAVNTFTNLKRTLAMCNCPDEGTLQQVLTLDADSPLGSGTFTKTYTFVTCGAGNFTVTASTASNIDSTGANANGTFRWDSCQ